ncbi:MAG: PKD domain-containing protein [Bacteroidetes bacterium]|nr:MAG: PKD domain-containing protein [Bacteroidota bacterium]
MKPRTLLLVMGLLLGTSVVLVAQGTFLKVFEVQEGNMPDRVRITSSVFSPQFPGLLFLNGYQVDIGETGAYRQVVLLVTTEGEVVKSTTFFANNTAQPQDNDGYVKTLWIDEDGEIFLAGTKNDPTLGHAFAMKVDTADNIWFTRTYGGSFSVLEGQLVKKLNIGGKGRLYVVGRKDQGGFDWIPFIAEVDDTDGSLKKYLHVNTPNVIYYPSGFYALPTGNLSLWGNEENLGGVTRDVWMIVDTTLNLLSAPVAFDLGGDFNMNSLSKASVMTAEFTQINAGFCQNTTTGKNSLYAYSISTNGEINWAKVYSFGSSINNGGSNGVYDVLEHGSYAYILAEADLTNPYYFGDIILLKIDKFTGELIWEKYMGANFQGDWASFHPRNIHTDGDFLYITGSVNLPDVERPFLLKTDMDGNWTDDCYNNLPHGGVTVTDVPVDNSNIGFSVTNLTEDNALGTQAFNFPTKLVGEVRLPVAQAIIPNVVCLNDPIVVTDQSSYGYSWNYLVKDCGFWQNGSLFDLPPGATHDAIPAACTGRDSVLFLVKDVSDATINQALCVDSLWWEVLVQDANLQGGFVYQTDQLTVQFSDTTSGSTAWMWDFGDGNSSTEANPSHTYAAPGTYNVCLTVSSPCASATTCQMVMVDVTSVREVEAAPFRVLPNPFSEEILLSNPQGVDLRSLELYDARGNLLRRFEGGKQPRFLLQGLGDLPSGTYLLKLHTAAGRDYWLPLLKS